MTVASIVISNDVIKGCIIAYLKSISEIVAKLVELDSSAIEIREYQWKNDTFVYPCVRVRIIRNAPDFGNCSKSDISFSVMTFTEDQSSAICDELSGIIATYFQAKQFGVSLFGDTYNFGIGRVTLIPAITVGTTTWRSEVILEAIVSKQ